MSEELKPVGTEFEMAFEPDRFCNRVRWRVFTYRVVAHDLVRHGLAERIEPIELKEYPAPNWMRLGGSYVPVPPAEIRHLVAGWDRFTG